MLDDIVRDGARQMLATALKAEFAAYSDARQLTRGGHRHMAHKLIDATRSH